MFSFPALDVVLGLVLAYFLLSIVCSSINEAFATALRWRSRDLERAIKQLLGGHEPVFRSHPLIATMVDPDRRAKVVAKARQAAERRGLGGRVDELRKNGLAEDVAYLTALAEQNVSVKANLYPSYIPSRTFVAALLGGAYQTTSAVKNDPQKVEDAINALPAGEVREALLALYQSAQRDAVAFRKNAERWYDDTMERVSGWYRRRVQKVIFILSLAIALLINADTLGMARYLWETPGARSAVVSAASNAKSGEKPAAAFKDIQKLPLPLGWHLKFSRTDPQGFPVYDDWHMGWALLEKLIGIALTTAALMLGAPFWFDTLSKLARLRGTGAPPPASDAVRHGEGEETRAAPTTLVVQAKPTAEAG